LREFFDKATFTELFCAFFLAVAKAFRNINGSGIWKILPMK
jgi:hypothetical protein